MPSKRTRTARKITIARAPLCTQVMLNSENDLDELLANEEGPVQVSVSAMRDQEQTLPPPPQPPQPPHPPRASSPPPPPLSFPSPALGVGGVPPPAFAALSSAGFYPPNPYHVPQQQQQSQTSDVRESSNHGSAAVRVSTAVIRV